MSTVKEEAIVELGLDSKAMKMGVESATNYFRQWIQKGKSEQEKYTNWWVQELKKRSDAEVAAAADAWNRRRKVYRYLDERKERKRNQDQELADLMAHGREMAAAEAKSDEDRQRARRMRVYRYLDERRKRGRTEVFEEISGGYIPDNFSGIIRNKKDANKKISERSKNVREAKESLKAFGRVSALLGDSVLPGLSNALYVGELAFDGIKTAARGALVPFMAISAALAGVAGIIGHIVVQRQMFKAMLGEAESQKDMSGAAKTIATSLRGIIKDMRESGKIGSVEAATYLKLLNHPTLRGIRSIQKSLTGTDREYDKRLEYGLKLVELEDETAPKINKLKREEREIQAQLMKNNVKDIDRIQLKIDLTKKHNEILEEQKRIDDSLTEKKRKQADLDKQAAERAARLVDLKNNLKSHQGSEFLPTLDELSQTGIYRKDASRLNWLMQDAKDAALWGDKRGRGQDLSEIQSIRSKLSAAGVYEDPNQSLIEEIKKAAAETTVVIKSMGN